MKHHLFILSYGAGILHVIYSKIFVTNTCVFRTMPLVTLLNSVYLMIIKAL